MDHILIGLTTGEKIAILAVIVPVLTVAVGGLIKHFWPKNQELNELRERVAIIEKQVTDKFPPVQTKEEADTPFSAEAKAEYEQIKAALQEELDLAQDKFNTELQIKVEAQISLAGGLVRQAKYKEAEQAYRTTLAGHADNRQALTGLGLVLYALARYRECEEIFRNLLRQDEKELGPDHPKVAIRLNNLAALYQATNRLKEAEPLYKRALEIDEAAFGKDHPKVAIRLNNLASLLKDTNRLSEAEPMYRRALKILEDSYGPDHPNTKTVRENLESLEK